jgi:hypothetical protein
MTGLPLGNCRNCGADVSHFACRCTSCGASNLPNPVATISALLVVGLIGGVTALGVFAFRGVTTSKSASQSPSKGRPQAEMKAATKAAANSAPQADAATNDDYSWIVAAMAECEEEAKLKTDTMHFLIVPVTTTTTSMLGWTPAPISPVGRAAVLINSTDTLIGLRNRALALYRNPLAFAVSDPATQTVYKWKPAVGVTALKTRESNSANLTLGFEISDHSKEVEWGPTINLQKGSCYWINPLIRARAPGG